MLLCVKFTILGFFGIIFTLENIGSNCKYQKVRGLDEK
jgi:hypothetical protein